LFAWQHDCVRWSSAEAECSLIEEEDASSGNLLQLAAHGSDLVTQAS
jgi:hypothetical protein